MRGFKQRSLLVPTCLLVHSSTDSSGAHGIIICSPLHPQPAEPRAQPGSCTKVFLEGQRLGEWEVLGEMEEVLLRVFCPNTSLNFSPWTAPSAQRKEMSNGSSITEFLLLAFADTRELQLLHFWLFLGIYLAALLGNGLIITAIACDHRLHTPMYFFLLNLSVLDLGSISTTVPKSMANSLWDTRAISYVGCAAQVFIFFFLVSAEYFLL
ncbi:olfactory receptor family 14 protein, partial [Klebsiella pneumoniae]|nr:olfactory receptor family 14 protein [Klebsiella pneumoniae]